MTQIRQDAWSDEEDHFLAKLVLQYIENGHTQIEAFKVAGGQLNRTPAACGYRWNATLREHYISAIDQARKQRKGKGQNKAQKQERTAGKENPIASAIALLEQIDPNILTDEQKAHDEELLALKKENKRLQEQVIFYEAAWQEMGKIWQWTQDQQV